MRRCESIQGRGRRRGPDRAPVVLYLFAGTVAATIALGHSTPAGATVVQALEFNDKVAKTPVIVHGLVERAVSEWALPDARIRTMITVAVTTSLKGDFRPGERLLVQRGGGTVDGITQSAPGLSTYEPGEEVVLFLAPLGAHYVAVGIGIGKYAVKLEDGEPWVHHAPTVYGLHYTPGRPTVAPIPPMSPEPLDAFFKRVRTALTKPTRPSTPKVRPATRGLRQLRPPPKLPTLSSPTEIRTRL